MCSGEHGIKLCLKHEPINNCCTLLWIGKSTWVHECNSSLSTPATNLKEQHMCKVVLHRNQAQQANLGLLIHLRYILLKWKKKLAGEVITFLPKAGWIGENAPCLWKLVILHPFNLLLSLPIVAPQQLQARLLNPIPKQPATGGGAGESKMLGLLKCDFFTVLQFHRERQGTIIFS